MAVSILTVIVLALFGMFDQTQKALRANVAQVDVLEGGRTALDLLAREIEQMAAPTASSNIVGFFTAFADIPRYQRLAGDDVRRTNILSEFYFLTRSNRVWTGVGYRVLDLKPSNPRPGQDPVWTPGMANEGFGFLARRALSVTNLDSIFFPTNQDPAWSVLSRAQTNLWVYQRLTSGVVHFRVRALDAFGQPIPTGAPASPWFRDILYSPLDWRARPLGPTNLVFFGGALPAAVEIELGVLEPQTLDRLRGFDDWKARTNYLARQATRVHLFQQRIPIRNAARTLYLQP